jgi:hypothetical protein
MSYVEEQEDFDLHDAYEEELTDQDYGFVLGPDGELKSVFVPNDMMSVPDKVKNIFSLFGIEDPHTVFVHTIH